MMKKSELLEQCYRWVRAKRDEFFPYPERTLSPREDAIWKMGYKYAMNEIAQYLNVSRITAEQEEAKNPNYEVWVECDKYCPNIEAPRKLRTTWDPEEAIMLMIVATDTLHSATIRKEG